MADAIAFQADVDSAAAPRPSRRTLVRPRALPGRRAIVGAILVAVALVGLFTSFVRAESGGGYPVVVAAHDLPAGARIGPSDLRVLTLRLPAETRGHSFRSVVDLRGRVVVGPVAEGELVQRASVTGRGEQPPFRQLTVLVDAAQLQAVEEGDVVDVLVTTGTGTSARTDVAAGGARVLRVARRSGSLGSDAKVGVTFALPSFDDITRLVEASHAGTLTLVRSTGFEAQPTTYDPGRRADTRP